MRKIIAGLFVSLDGVAEAPDQWHFPYFNDEMGEVVGEQMAGSDTMLLGRQTYEEFFSYWPNSDDDIADYMNNASKIVVSATLEKAEWNNTTLISTDVIKSLVRLKQQTGKDISITGSITLVRSLLEAEMIDELSLLIHPVVIGKGKRWFGDQKVPLKLAGSKTLSTGVIHAIYSPAGR